MEQSEKATSPTPLNLSESGAGDDVIPETQPADLSTPKIHKQDRLKRKYLDTESTSSAF